MITDQSFSDLLRQAVRQTDPWLRYGPDYTPRLSFEDLLALAKAEEQRRKSRWWVKGLGMVSGWRPTFRDT
jgi:hypothetical protein